MYFVILSVFLVVVHTSQNSVGASPMPSYTEVIYEPPREYDMPESCIYEGKNYCFDKGDSYPDETVEKLLQKIRFLDVVGTPRTPQFFNHRSSADRPKEPDCQISSTDKPVYYIFDDENKQVRVVIQSTNFTQIYNMEWCLHEGRIDPIYAPYTHFMEKTLTDFNFECVTTDLLVDFLVLNEDDPSDLKIEIVAIKIPVCCRCRINSINK